MAPKAMTDDELIKLVEEAFDEALEVIFNEDGWKEMKKNDHGDVVVTKKSKKGKKMYRITATIDCDINKLAEALKDTSKLTTWNTTLTKCDTIKDITDDVKITYQITAAGGPGDMVSSRDFIIIFKTAFKGDHFVQAGCSVDYPGPSSSKLVRAWNGPTGTVLKPIPGQPDKCEFRWLMDCDYKGWIPNSVMEIAMPFAQMNYVECVRNLAKTL